VSNNYTVSISLLATNQIKTTTMPPAIKNQQDIQANFDVILAQCLLVFNK